MPLKSEERQKERIVPFPSKFGKKFQDFHKILGWFQPNRDVPKYLKNFPTQIFPICIPTKTSLSEKFEKNLISRPRPSRSKFYNIAIVLWILMSANISYQIYKF